uniref:Uncharacterized protein n=1 Tax=Tanacetum cinerariifolium TaxID=118510 RepID=A0A6L2KD13_TANCI|nr:hypothetical protein [Tanacetum cinerariifolium]
MRFLMMLGVTSTIDASTVTDMYRWVGSCKDMVLKALGNDMYAVVCCQSKLLGCNGECVSYWEVGSGLGDGFAMSNDFNESSKPRIEPIDRVDNQALVAHFTTKTFKPICHRRDLGAILIDSHLSDLERTEFVVERMLKGMILSVEEGGGGVESSTAIGADCFSC